MKTSKNQGVKSHRIPYFKDTLRNFFGKNFKYLPDGTLYLYNCHPFEYEEIREGLLQVEGISGVEFKQSLFKPKMF